jgi:RNA polymerase sigma-70 factor, ECF subfamily
MPTAAEDALVEQAQGGSSAAFTRLVENHQQAIRAFLRRLGGDWAEADDLAQETFVAAWLGLATFRRGASLRLWLYGIAYRKFLASRRASLRRRNRETSAADAALPGATTDADDRLDLRRAMMALPETQRAVVALCLAAEISHGDVAELLGLPLGTVKSYVQRGRATLISILDRGHE